MTISIKNTGFVSDFRVTTNLAVAIAAIVFLLPFAINNLVQGRYVLGAGSVVVVSLLAANSWLIYRGRFSPLLVFLGLLPVVAAFLVLAIRQQGIIGALWCYPAVIAFYFMLPERNAWLANLVILGIAISQSWVVLTQPLAVRVSATLLVVSVFSVIFVRIITAQQSRLRNLAETDPLTGLYNRNLLEASLEQAVEQYRRTNVPMTLVNLDLDHFKTINDTLGHDAGDNVLRGIGELLPKRIRRSDRAFRTGGEEFLVLLYGADRENGRQFAEDLRRIIEAATFVSDQSVTASLGVATLESNETWKPWLKRSDENLYRAKTAGRNQVVA